MDFGTTDSVSVNETDLVTCGPALVVDTDSVNDFSECTEELVNILLDVFEVKIASRSFTFTLAEVLIDVASLVGEAKTVT